MTHLAGRAGKVLFLSVLTAMLLAATAFAADIATGAGTTTGSSLRLRSEPSTSASVVTMLDKGVSVAILDDSADGWYKIGYNGSTASPYSYTARLMPSCSYMVSISMVILRCSQNFVRQVAEDLGLRHHQAADLIAQDQQGVSGRDAEKAAGLLGDDDLSPVAHLGGAEDPVFGHAQHVLASRHGYAPFEIIFFTQV